MILPILSFLFVPGPGIEPGWIAPTVFETVASTDSAIRALVVVQSYEFILSYARVLSTKKLAYSVYLEQAQRQGVVVLGKITGKGVDANSGCIGFKQKPV